MIRINSFSFSAWHGEGLRFYVDFLSSLASFPLTICHLSQHDQPHTPPLVAQYSHIERAASSPPLILVAFNLVLAALMMRMRIVLRSDRDVVDSLVRFERRSPRDVRLAPCIGLD